MADWQESKLKEKNLYKNKLGKIVKKLNAKSV